MGVGTARVVTCGMRNTFGGAWKKPGGKVREPFA